MKWFVCACRTNWRWISCWRKMVSAMWKEQLSGELPALFTVQLNRYGLQIYSRNNNYQTRRCRYHAVAGMLKPWVLRQSVWHWDSDHPTHKQIRLWGTQTHCFWRKKLIDGLLCNMTRLWVFGFTGQVGGEFQMYDPSKDKDVTFSSRSQRLTFECRAEL